MIFNRRFGDLGKLLSKDSTGPKRSLVFQSLLSGEDISLNVCSFEEVLPYSLLSIPISTITTHDNVWIAASMLARISDATNNLVVVEDGFPIGTIDARRIVTGLQKNPTSEYFEKSVSKIMSPDFYIDSRNINISSILKRMNKTRNFFTVVENDKTNFSQFSIKQVLEVGSLCRSDITASSISGKKIPTFSRDDKIKDVIRRLEGDTTCLLALKDDITFISYEVLLEKIKELNTPQNDNLLDLSASTLKTITPTLISEKLSLAEICKVMLSSRYPYVMTQDQIITPEDIVDLMCKEI
jgi:predicted transcriptional regulator